MRQEEVPGGRSLRVLYIALYTKLCRVPSVISIILAEGELAWLGWRASNGTAKVAATGIFQPRVAKAGIAKLAKFDLSARLTMGGFSTKLSSSVQPRVEWQQNL